jgi:hypothetical protein
VLENESFSRELARNQDLNRRMMVEYQKSLSEKRQNALLEIVNEN